MLNNLQKPIKSYESTSKRVIRKTEEATGDLIGNKNTNRITKVSKSSPQSNSESIKNEHDKEVSKERNISSRKTENY